MTASLDALENWQVALLDRLQDGIDLVDAPFDAVAAAAGQPVAAVLDTVQRALDDGLLTRFGPMYSIERAGGHFTLAALAVPADRFDDVAAWVNGHDAIAHNYRRDHHWNMWFVVATESASRCDQLLNAFRAHLKLPLLDLPKEREFRVHLRFRLAESAAAMPAPGRAPAASALPLPPASPGTLDAFDQRVVRATQAGLPITAQPWATVAENLGADADAVLASLRGMRQRGVLRRVAAVPDHYAWGWRFNGMTVWDVPDDVVDTVGAQVAGQKLASHCYRRPRRDGWPFNLFAMFHARTAEQARREHDALTRCIGPHARRHDVLYSTAILKKTGLRLPALSAPFEPIPPCSV